MAVTLRPLLPDDAPDVLALNHEVVEKLAPMDRDRYRWFLETATLAQAALVGQELAGFVLVLGPGLDYESENYRWFSGRHQHFLYLDRVAVHQRFRRVGVASAIYDAVESEAAGRRCPVLLEINLDPPNQGSLAFHGARGYREIATLRHGDEKVVSLQVKDPIA